MEIKKLTEMIAKRVYPETEKEKTCIEAFGKLVMKRGHLSKAIIQTISKYESEAAKKILDSPEEQAGQNSAALPY